MPAAHQGPGQGFHGFDAPPEARPWSQYQLAGETARLLVRGLGRRVAVKGKDVYVRGYPAWMKGFLGNFYSIDTLRGTVVSAQAYQARWNLPVTASAIAERLTKAALHVGRAGGPGTSAGPSGPPGPAARVAPSRH